MNISTWDKTEHEAKNEKGLQVRSKVTTNKVSILQKGSVIPKLYTPQI